MVWRRRKIGYCSVRKSFLSSKKSPSAQGQLFFWRSDGSSVNILARFCMRFHLLCRKSLFKTVNTFGIISMSYSNSFVNFRRRIPQVKRAGCAILILIVPHRRIKTKIKMQCVKIVELPLEASTANFKSATELFITRPHLVDKRASGAIIQKRFLSEQDIFALTYLTLLNRTK